MKSVVIFTLVQIVVYFCRLVWCIWQIWHHSILVSAKVPMGMELVWSLNLFGID